MGGKNHISSVTLYPILHANTDQPCMIRTQAPQWRDGDGESQLLWDLRPALQEGIQAWYYQPGQKPMVMAVTGPVRNCRCFARGHVATLLSKHHLCPQISAALNLGQSGFSLQRAAVHALLMGHSAETSDG